MNEKSIAQTREKVIEREPNIDIDWISLVVNIDFISLRILEKFYRNTDSKLVTTNSLLDKPNKITNKASIIITKISPFVFI